MTSSTASALCYTFALYRSLHWHCLSTPVISAIEREPKDSCEPTYTNHISSGLPTNLVQPPTVIDNTSIIQSSSSSSASPSFSNPHPPADVPFDPGCLAMDFSNLSSYPMVANAGYSPGNDSFYSDVFNKACFSDSYATRPDYALDDFVNYDSFSDRPVSSVELSPGFAPKGQGVFNPSLQTSPASPLDPSVSSWPSIDNTSFAQMGDYQGFFPANLAFHTNVPGSSETDCESPGTSSRTPSLCGDGPQTPSLTPRSLKRESPSSPAGLDDERAPKKPQRKRGRPRIDRNLSDATSGSSSSAKCKATQRLPHNQVERKYREGLNSELERLRRAVPTLTQRDPQDLTGPPKPSKATILASAIEYIEKLERERDALCEENEKLRGMRSHPSRTRT